jgi:hypothetical protein
LGISHRFGIPDSVAGKGRGRESQPVALLVVEHPFLLRVSARPASPPGTSNAEHLMEGELRGPPDDLESFLGIGYSGELDDDAFLPRPLQARLGYSQLVDAPPQDLERPGDRVGVDLLGFGRLSLQDDLGPAPKVETQTDGTGDDERDGSTYDGENAKRSPNHVT